MALNYKTYYAIPHLRTYAEAKEHYDKVDPIRGDANETRPCGRRDQKWFSIWLDDSVVRIGYGYGGGEDRRPLVSYHPSGTITVHKPTRWASASDNERRQRLLGTEFTTFQYDTWVKCAWFDRGEKRKGWLPLRCNGNRIYTGPESISTFARDTNGELVFLDYVYPVIHKPNRPALKQAMEPFKPFVRFVNGLLKLQGSHHLTFTSETKAEYFGWSDAKDYRGQHYTKNPPQLLYGPDMEVNRAWFYEKAASDNHDDWMKAAITMAYHGTSDTTKFITDLLLRDRQADLLTAEGHTDGKLVKDRYARYVKP